MHFVCIITARPILFFMLETVMSILGLRISRDIEELFSNLDHNSTHPLNPSKVRNLKIIRQRIVGGTRWKLGPDGRIPSKCAEIPTRVCIFHIYTTQMHVLYSSNLKLESLPTNANSACVACAFFSHQIALHETRIRKVQRL